MLRSLFLRVGMLEICKRPLLWPKLISVLLTQQPHAAREVYNSIVTHHRSQFRLKQPKQADKVIDFLCSLHLREESFLQSDRYQELNWICKSTRQGTRVTRAWIDAIQQELNLSLIPKELLQIQRKTSKILNLCETIHYIHQATYNIMKYKQVAPSYSMIFRNAIHPQQELVMLNQELTQLPQIEYDKIKVGTDWNTRCCSIKPHGCENYDFDMRISRKFVIARGMDEKDYNNYECVMPTILYTLHERYSYRFKGNVSRDQIITVSGAQLHEFFFLYEQASI